MDNKAKGTMTFLVVAVFVLIAWGSGQDGHRRRAEAQLELYRERLSKFEDLSIIENIIDSLESGYAAEMREEEKAMRSR